MRRFGVHLHDCGGWFIRFAALLSIGAIPLWGQCGLMSWEEYNATRYKFPYVLRLPSSNGELLAFGAQHSNDPNHAQFPELERLWGEFRPQVAFSEGGIRPASPSHNAAIRRFGEPGLLRFLADRDHVTLRNLEPVEDQEAAFLMKRFDAGRVKLFYYLRDVASLPSEPHRPMFEYMESRRRISDGPKSLEEAEALAGRLLPQFNAASVPKEWFDPTRHDNFLNDISVVSSEYRNCHMVPLIVDAVRAGKRVFVVVGGSHVVVQEKALRFALAQ